MRPFISSDRAAAHGCAAVAAMAVLALAGSPASGQEPAGIVVPLTDPTRPATLEVALVRGSLKVTASDSREIVIVDRESMDTQRSEPGREGLRRINTFLGLTAEEQNNTVTVSVGPHSRDVALELLVPRTTSVRARIVQGDELRIEGVSGEHELSSVNGDVVAVDVSGSMVVATTNGDMEISFAEVATDKPMSFTSFNGDLEVWFPADLAAELSIQTHRGDVLTDFDLRMQPLPRVVDSGRDEDGRYRVRQERAVRAIVGGGGPEVHFKTFNGDIVIRRR